MRRPTINFSQWKFSVDLKETSDIQNQEGLPASGCDCEDCSSWRKYYIYSLPEDLLDSFKRIGVDLDYPSDCYGSGDNLRVIFHVVGEIQIGPDSKIFNKNLNENIMNYVPIRQEPWLSVMVLPARDSFEPSPKRANGTDHGVICIDMRLKLVKSSENA
ncbi:MAG: hypothetical protein HWE27_03815 [Gammaproteobacteria bacterium]|nr:hypothetical protein [Gammaproteobacteria bacterium]